MLWTKIWGDNELMKYWSKLSVDSCRVIIQSLEYESAVKSVYSIDRHSCIVIEL